MNRRFFLKQCAATAAAGAVWNRASQVNAGVQLFNKTLAARIGKRKPNVIYVLADDLGYGDVGCYGQLKVKTPNLDKMAAEGMRFTQHYAGSTVCAPSRCSLMTGQHTGHCYIRGNSDTISLPAANVTVAEIFKQAGYQTACIGKWGLGEVGTPGHPNKQGFDYYYGFLSQVAAHRYYPDASSPIWENETNASLDGKTYSHDVFTEKALNYITEKKDYPFFLYLTYTIPHAELLVPNEPDLVKYQSLGWAETPFPGGWYAAQPTPHAAFAAMITRLDRDLGRILKLLKDLGLDEDTLVIFTSDNGPHAEGGGDPTFFNSSGPFKGIKRALYEGGIRVPMAARWPGTIAPGRTTDHISAFWDFLPTCCDLTGQPVPDGVDGISFLPTLLSRTQPTHDYLYWEFYEENGKQAVRLGNWKMVRLNVSTYLSESAYLSDVSPTNVKLYDLSTNLGESDTYNLVSSNTSKTQELKNLIVQAHVYSSNFHYAWEQS